MYYIIRPMKVLDLHIHGIGDFDTNAQDAGQIISLCEELASHSVFDVVLAIYPAPIPEMRRRMEAVKSAMGVEGGARIHGVHLEGPFLNPERCGALTPSYFLTPSVDNLNMLIEGYEEIVKIVTLSPELEGALDLIEHIRAMGILVNMGHSDATYEQAEEGFRRGATGITHIFNAQRPFHHRQPGLAGFGLTNPDIYVEVIADGLHLHRATIDLVFRAKPKERIILVSDCVSRRELVRGLVGGEEPLKSITDRLLREGYPEDLVESWAWHNPWQYLALARVPK